MWKILQQIIPVLLVILVLTQYVIPVLFNLQTWWLFKPSKNKNKQVDSSPLEVQIKETKEIVDSTKNKVEDIRTKVDENLKSAEDLKKDADKLL